MASFDRALERINADGTVHLVDDALLMPLRCDESQDVIDQEQWLAWDELLGLR